MSDIGNKRNSEWIRKIRWNLIHEKLVDMKQENMETGEKGEIRKQEEKGKQDTSISEIYNRRNEKKSKQGKKQC